MPNITLEALLREEAANDPEPIETTLKIERLLARASAHVRPPNRKEVEAFYRLNRRRFWLPETIRVAQIVKNVTETFPREEAVLHMKSAQAELARGAAFAEIVERFSDCPTDAGDLGWFPRGEMVEEFDEQVFALAEGQTSGIFETRFGFHIARLTARRSDGIQPLSVVRESISARLYEQRKQQALNQYLESLMAKNESLLRPK